MKFKNQLLLSVALSWKVLMPVLKSFLRRETLPQNFSLRRAAPTDSAALERRKPPHPAGSKLQTFRCGSVLESSVRRKPAHPAGSKLQTFRCVIQIHIFTQQRRIKSLRFQYIKFNPMI
ncbi:hypothetical protein FNW02_30080 [Komarekiella sp. 'clone 1']|uniref:Uncharacterized protein n=1 Tax=Komarekiella delphini-convector SJRDD-AB1 TaxID=2593771 RepID=A0AA40T2X5_9NOST|nr:hypothetical protein [Komarekiella delphini-convector]MBD6619938.1 hypothetical protein [Komarekiella delphini-convector SJRDD-AB1]